MKTIVILLDGVADRPSKELNYKTPLQYANIPNLDEFAKSSLTGLMCPQKIGVPLGTEVAHFLLWGYDISQFPGRGVIEALGEGIDLKKDSIYLRATLGHVNYNQKENNFLVLDRRTKDINNQEISELLNKISNINIDGYLFTIHHMQGIHSILEISKLENDGNLKTEPNLKKNNLKKNGFELTYEEFCNEKNILKYGNINNINNCISNKISDSDPFYKDRHVIMVKPVIKLIGTYEEYLNALNVSNALNKYLTTCNTLLENDSINISRKNENKSLANFLLTKWAGSYKKLPSFKQKWGLNGVIIANSSLFRGLAKLLKMDYYEVKEFDKAIELGLKFKNDNTNNNNNSNNNNNNNQNNNINNKKIYDFIHIHTKEPDEAGHTKNPINKVRVLEKLDKNLKVVIDEIDKEKENGDENLYIITGDHATPSTGGLIHSGELVPIAICGKNVGKDSTKAFNEMDVLNGYYRINSTDIMNLVLNYTDKALLYGLRPNGDLKKYIPEDNELEFLKKDN
ncbi:alkaline phosphatase family protein [Methanococcus voltae]|uniref:Phosphonopyruvate decarboxylase-related protein n=1 Tax=Methanococcus voltae (strain ATCC BAA-1334 / A3) TaxID=456320 RepID=D7DTG5_METV3|nr:alkaline phosphatase family protein [Methanococcus voltae]MCS3901277.1 2,3-bisphosphoglycerate-independent phosphoglycerate mutase [Methanococcus voltae]